MCVSVCECAGTPARLRVCIYIYIYVCMRSSMCYVYVRGRGWRGEGELIYQPCTLTTRMALVLRETEMPPLRWTEMPLLIAVNITFSRSKNSVCLHDFLQNDTLKNWFHDQDMFDFYTFAPPENA